MQTSIDLVRFRIGEVRYVLPVNTVAAILDLPAIDMSDQGDERWMGVIRSHQGVIRVADGAGLLGRPARRPLTAKVLVLRSTPPVGMVVDEVFG
ncbi:MAG TPA: chemotaxis protein CheW, partial [Thermomicrobiales bacterium]|nr:chemotaxis protein CheW [Thermomicrobiales bacterium]